ncbi:hypothetical protein PH547_21135 [Rhizobium sp. CNPSo 3464]|uniref:hypothetical protein n=1 Tax=Rhizobium sp. CNPSo 3464 TaxID=3021406 RepID=UPI00254B5C28|nr:hypothetical protein [Rhizobium sp. CNPSo 3464]MDK4741394.1 hypothetical protein [Rhizobium sp. CNPSo 3464]
MLSQYSSIALSAVDQTIDAVLAAVHSRGRLQNLVSPLSLSFAFRNQEHIRISCSSDGETIRIDEEVLNEFTLGEYGTIEAIDISTAPEFSKIVGNTINDINFLISEIGDRFVGLSIIFSNGTAVFIANIGDDLRYFDAPPETFMEEEKIRSVSVKNFDLL